MRANAAPQAFDRTGADRDPKYVVPPYVRGRRGYRYGIDPCGNSAQRWVSKKTPHPCENAWASAAYSIQATRLSILPDDASGSPPFGRIDCFTIGGGEKSPAGVTPSGVCVTDPLGDGAATTSSKFTSPDGSE